MARYIGWVNEPGDLVERVILGDEILQKERKTFPIDPIFTGNRSEQITGTIGFVDFKTVATYEEIEKPRELYKGCAWLGLDIKMKAGTITVPKVHTAIEVSIIGIEPEYQGNEYSLELMEEVERIARDRRIDIVVSKGPHRDNEASRRFHEKAEFTQENRFFITDKWGDGYYYDYYKYAS